MGTQKLWAVKDNANGNLNAGISASITAIPLESGDGANFPTTYNGTATSAGTSATLNDTGIGVSGVAVGDAIYNRTDRSWAIVTAVATNSVTTTPLQGGTDNTWDSADTWVVNPFIITLVQYNTTNDPDSGVNKREKVLIIQRSGDNLTAETSIGRGYDGSTGQTFLVGDNVYLFVKAADIQGLQTGIADLYTRLNTAEDLLDTALLKDGTIALNNNTNFIARNAANNANVNLFKLTASDVLEFQTLPRNPSSRSISNNYDMIDKKYFDDNSNDTFLVTYGETIAIGEILYQSAADSKYYKGDGNDTSKIRVSVVAVEAGVLNDSKRVRKGGVGTVVKEGGGSFTINSMVYLADTAGAGTHTPSSTRSVPIGIANSTTTVLLMFGKKMARGTGTSYGTASSTNNEVITLGFRPSLIVLSGKVQANNSSTIEQGFLNYVDGVFAGGFAYDDLNSIDSANMPSGGLTRTGGGSTSTLSVQSVTDTGFTIRTVNASTPGGSSNINWYAIGD